MDDRGGLALLILISKKLEAPKQTTVYSFLNKKLSNEHFVSFYPLHVHLGILNNVVDCGGKNCVRTDILSYSPLKMK